MSGARRIRPAVGGGRVETVKCIVSVCDLKGPLGHLCERGHAAAFRERAVHVVVHRAAETATVGVHLHAARIQFTKSGESAVTELLAHWHAMGFHSETVQPKSYLDPLRARWLGIKVGLVDRVVADVQELLARPEHFAPMAVPGAGAMP